MKIIESVQSLFEFQKRVLFLGTPKDSVNYNSSEIKNMFRFNEIFINNVDEMHSKYDLTPILDQCLYYIGICQYNIEKLLSLYLSLDKIIPKDDEVVFSEDIYFEDIVEHDMLFEYPYNDFYDYVKFIKHLISRRILKKVYISLYRVDDHPELFRILYNARKYGVESIINVELFARGDENNNSFWRLELKKKDIHIYSHKSGYTKIHCKLMILEVLGGSIIQIGTGNYNPITTRQYTDLSLLSYNSSLAEYMKYLFKEISGLENIRNKVENLLMITQFNAYDELDKLIDSQAELGEDGFIFIKCNSINDNKVINKLDYASKCGCKMIIISRSVCTWIPDNVGKNVIIKSMVWDLLEHSRVYLFGKVNPIIYIGSLDLTVNKLNKRIEVMIRITDPNIKGYMVDYVNRYISNNRNCWFMDRNGNWIREN